MALRRKAASETKHKTKTQKTDSHSAWEVYLKYWIALLKQSLRSFNAVKRFSILTNSAQTGDFSVYKFNWAKLMHLNSHEMSPELQLQSANLLTMKYIL